MNNKVTIEEFKRACDNLDLSGRAELIDIFMTKIDSDKAKLEKAVPLNLRENDILKMNQVSFSWVTVANFIEENIKYYSTKPSLRQGKVYRQNGVRLINNEMDEENNVFPNKRIILQIKKQDYTRDGKDVYRVDFNLLDDVHKNYSKLLEDNVSSVIDSMDNNSFIYKNVDLRRQLDKQDKLFGVVSIDDTIYNICEYGTSWLLQTGWNYTFVNANEQLKDFCNKHDLDYHYSYQISYDNLYFAIREYNTKIEESLSLINKSKVEYDSELDKLDEYEKLTKFKQMFVNVKKIKNSLAIKTSFLLEQNQIVLEAIKNKLNGLKIELILDSLKTRDESLNPRNDEEYLISSEDEDDDMEI